MLSSNVRAGWRLLMVFGLTTALPRFVLAQATNAGESDAAEEETVVLSPFEVTTNSDVGYQATETLSGSRLRTDLRDIGASISVVTSEMLEDLGATDNETLLAWLTNSEVGGPLGNYSGGPTISGVDFGPRENDLFLNPNQNNRVRGLSSADNTRNYFLSDVPWDGYNTSRVDFQRGPNAMLAGLGSPAGLINTSPDQAVFRTQGEVAVRTDQFGSLRGSINYNQVLLENELAVRVAALRDRKKFRQDPAFQNADRYYGAIRYAPKALNSGSSHFEVKGDFEYGKITSNRPRNVTPQDNITPFFRTDQWGFNQETFNHITDTRPAGIIVGNSGYDPVYYINSPGQPFASRSGVSNNSRFLIENIPNGYGTLNRDGQIQGFDGVPTGSVSVQGVNRPLWQIGAKNQIASAIGADYAGFYGIETLSDSGVFDFYNQLIDGPNKGESSEWTTYDFGVSQTFLDNQLGYDVVVGGQEMDQSRFAAMGWGNRIFIDIDETNPDGSANPNVGRAYISEKLQQTGQQDYRNDREAVRAQVYFAHDFTREKDSFLSRLLGQQRITGLASQEISERKSWGTKAYAVDPTFNTLFTSNSNTAGNAVTPAFKEYVSDDLRGISSVSDIHASNLSSNVLFQQKEIPVTYWDPTWTASGVNPGDPWELPENFTGTPVDTPADPEAGTPAVGIQASNPANYRGWTTENVRIYSPFIDPNEIVNGTSMSVRDYLAVGASAARSRIRSNMLIWQGKLWNGSVTGLYGWRRDKAYSYIYNQNGTPDARPDGGANLDDSVLNFDNPIGQRSYLEGTSTNWSIAVHTNRLFGDRDPLPFNVSLYYNQGENFQPKDGRVDLSGADLPAPLGKTKEYSVALSTKDNRYSVKLTKYETSETDAALTAALQNWAFEQTMDMKNFWTPAAFYEQVIRFQNGETGPGGNRNRNPIDIDSLNVDDQRKAELHRGITGWGEFMTAMVQQFPEFVDSFGGITTPRNEYYPAGYGFWLGRKNWAFTEDRQSKGYELEFIANPTPNWRMMVNASKTDAMRTNVPGDYNGRFLDFVDHWLWETDAGLLPVYDPSNVPLRQGPYNNFHNSYLQAKALNGQRAGEIRQWKINAFTNYSFTEGALKGLGVGGGVRWEDKAAIGYDVTTLQNEVGDNYDIIDVSKPFYAPSETTVDLWVSYSRRITDSIRWKVQVNVNNVFGSNEVIPISTQPGGAGAVYRIKEGAAWTLTNTFAF